MNKKERFTPGPWTYKHEMVYGVDDPSGKTIAYCGNAADGNLIEKAPDLYASIKRMIPWLGLLISHNGHKDSVAPLDCENALAEAEALILSIEVRND